jgi:hypothetical protein
LHREEAGDHVGLFDEIQSFMAAHKLCGRLSGVVATPSSEGYSVDVRCQCGKAFRRWVTAEAAGYDLIYSTLLCNPN